MSGTLPVAVATRGDFVGVPVVTLQLWLLEAQTALHKLQNGGQVQSLSYSQGNGSKSVSYTAGTLDNLRAHITALKLAIGLPSGRRPIRPYFL